MTTKEFKTFKVQVYRTPSGKPTCCSDFPAGDVCEWLGFSNFGQVGQCALTQEKVNRPYHAPLSYLIPDEKCPFWKSEQPVKESK
jgi:hypothetical protein